MAEIYSKANSNAYSDLEMFLRTDNTGNISKVYGSDSINQSIKTILSTMPGERLMLPQFGCAVRAMLFENMNEDTTFRLQFTISEAIRRWENRVNLVNVTVNADYDRNLYDITVVYTIIESGERSYLSAKLRSFA